MLNFTDISNVKVQKSHFSMKSSQAFWLSFGTILQMFSKTTTTLFWKNYNLNEIHDKTNMLQTSVTLVPMACLISSIRYLHNVQMGFPMVAVGSLSSFFDTKS